MAWFTRTIQVQERPDIGTADRAWGPQSSGRLASSRARTRAAQGRAAASDPSPGAEPASASGPAHLPGDGEAPPTSRCGAPQAASLEAFRLYPLAFPATGWRAHQAHSPRELPRPWHLGFSEGAK